jgi:hypothetical protein
MNLKKVWEGLKEKKEREIAEAVIVYGNDEYFVKFCEDVPDHVVELDKKWGQAFGVPVDNVKVGPVTCIVIKDEQSPHGIIALMLYGDHRADLLPILTDIEKLKKFFEDHKEHASPICYQRWLERKQEPEKKETSIGFVQDFKKAA